MGDPFAASTQYDEITGTTAFDGHGSAHEALYAMAEKTAMPEDDFVPVGFNLYRLDPDEVTGVIYFSLFAVNKNDYGVNYHDIAQGLNSSPKPVVYSFDGQLRPDEFGMIFKRIDMKALYHEIDPSRIEIEYVSVSK